MNLFNRPSRKVAAAISDYRRDGVAVIKDILPQDVVDQARDAWRRLNTEIAEGRSELKRSARFVYNGDLPSGGLDEMASHPALVDVARRILGPDIALYFNRLLVKDAVWNGPVAAHQDCVYFHGGSEKLSIFVPLEPFTKATGNLSFAAGSHLYGNLGVRGTVKVADFPDLPVVAPDAYPGDVILATFTVWHYSEAAEIECERPVMQIAYQPASDGSYYGEPNEPRLIKGRWRTKSFTRYNDHILPDG